MVAAIGCARRRNGRCPDRASHPKARRARAFYRSFSERDREFPSIDLQEAPLALPLVRA